MSNTNAIKKICSVPGCSNNYLAKGYCSGHLKRVHKGQPLDVIDKNSKPKYRMVPCLISGLEGDCHEWTGKKTPGGYGRVIRNHKSQQAHRHAWERDVGSIAAGLVLDHLCRNKLCCNVRHLRAVTRRINAIENNIGPTAINAAKTHCIHGHPFDELNTYIRTNGERRCRECQKRTMQKRAKKR